MRYNMKVGTVKCAAIFSELVLVRELEQLHSNELGLLIKWHKTNLRQVRRYEFDIIGNNVKQK